MTLQDKCKRHSWDEKLIEQFGNARCENCGMQYKNYKENLATLTAWTKAEIEQEPEHHKKLIKGIEECTPR